MLKKMVSNGLVIFLYCIFAYGFCNIMIFGEGPFRICERIRNFANSISEHFGKLFSCFMCLPANLGWILSIINWFFIAFPFTPFNIILVDTELWWLAMIGDCFFTSGIVWIIHNVESFFESIAEGKHAEEYEEVEDNDVINLND